MIFVTKLITKWQQVNKIEINQGQKLRDGWVSGWWWSSSLTNWILLLACLYHVMWTTSWWPWPNDIGHLVRFRSFIGEIWPRCRLRDRKHHGSYCQNAESGLNIAAPKNEWVAKTYDNQTWIVMKAFSVMSSCRLHWSYLWTYRGSDKQRYHVHGNKVFFLSLILLYMHRKHTLLWRLCALDTVGVVSGNRN